MKFIVVLVALIAIASAARVKKPIESYFSDFAGEEDIHLITGDDEAPPTNFVGDVMKAQTTSIKTLTGSKKFNYNFETQNGIKIASIGKLKDSKTFVVSGSYTYTGANGKKYRVRYTADEFGYHPVTEEDNEPEIVITPAPTAAPLPALKFPTFSPYGNPGQNRVGKQFGGPNSNTGSNGYNYNNGNGQGNGYNNGNGQGNGYNNGNGQGNGYNNGNGQGNGYNNRNGFGGAPNGYNTINQFGSFDRTGKSLVQNDLVFNKNFVQATVKDNTPNRLYLPAAPTYLPPQ